MRPSPRSISLSTVLLAALIGVSSERVSADDHTAATDDDRGDEPAARATATTARWTPPVLSQLGPLERPSSADAQVDAVANAREILTVEPGDIDVRTKVVTTAVEHGVVEVSDDERLAGERHVEVDGVDGTRRLRMRRVVVNGKPSDWELVADRVVSEPVDEVIAVGTREPEPEPEPETADTAVVAEGVWDRLAECESNGDWSINTGNGYYGGLQFNLETWQANDGQGMPHENSREEQIRIATILRDSVGGYGPWPACSAKLGLPQ